MIIECKTYGTCESDISLTVEGKLVTPGIADARVDTVRGSVIVTTIEKPELYAIPADAQTCSVLRVTICTTMASSTTT